MSHRNARTTFLGRLLIVQLRQRERRGADWLGAELGVPPRTVSRVLARHGEPRLCVLDPITGEVIRSSKATAVRYERDRPGEPAHMDIKKISRNRACLTIAVSRRWRRRTKCS